MVEPGAAVSWIADIASVVSLVVSLYVALQVRGIKRRFVRRFALQTFILQLGGHIGALSNYIDVVRSNDLELRGELARCQANVQSALPYLDRSGKQDAQDVIRHAKGQTPNLLRVLTILARLEQSLKNRMAMERAETDVD